MKIIIIGAGITGISCAFYLKNNDYLIFEKENIPGGLCRSVNLKNFIFDYTGHALHIKSNYAKNFIKNILKNSLIKVKRKSFIYFNNTYVKYPFQANLYGLSSNVIKDCLTDFINITFEYPFSIIPSPNLSFYCWVKKTFGEGFGKHFFFPYNSKLWTVSPKQLSCDWVGKFVPRPGLEEVINGTLLPQKKEYGYNIDFLYPKYGGIQSLIYGILEKINIKNLILNTEVKRINIKEKYIIINKQKINYDVLISTIPLPELLDIIYDLPMNLYKLKDKLRYNCVLCINLGIKPEDFSSRNKSTWIYFPSKDYIFYRVGFYNNFSKSLVPAGCISLYIETSFKPEDFSKINFDRILNKVKQDLFKCGLLKKNDSIKIVNFLPIKYAYVIYNKERPEVLKLIQGFLQKNNIYSIGRYGAWKYSYIEESILDAKKTVKTILK